MEVVLQGLNIEAIRLRLKRARICSSGLLVHVQHVSSATQQVQ